MAFLLVVAIVAFWWLAGWVVLRLVGLHQNLLRAALLAPAVGVAAVVVPLFELYRIGLPVRISGIVVTAALCVFVGVWAWRTRRRLLPPRVVLAPVVLGLMIGGAFVGAPLLTEGFAWISFCNDDMANYVLGAQGVFEQGYLHPYPAQAYVANADPYMQTKTVLDIAGLRCGAELLLAWVMMLTGYADHRVFMPVIVALQMALSGAVAGLICSSRRHRRQALLALLWVPFISLVVLGTVYQLIAQVLGLGLLAATAAVLLGTSRRTWLAAAGGGLLVGALGVSYPEVIPFLGLGTILHFGRRLHHSWLWLARVTGVALLIWNTFCLAMAGFFTVQLNQGVDATPARQFPFYIIPSGFPTFWGMMPIAGRLEGLWMDAAIALGVALTAVAAGAIFRQYRQGEPAGAMTLSLAVLAVHLFLRGADFGIYKLAMYLWPFLATVIVLSWWEWFRSTRFIALPLALLLIPVMALPVSWSYIAASAQWLQKGSGFVEVPRATEARLLDRLRALATQPRQPIVLVDTHNVVLAKIAGAYFRGESYRTPSKNFFMTSGRYLGSSWTNWFSRLARPGLFEEFQQTLRDRDKSYQPREFRMPAGGVNKFQLEQPLSESALPQRYTLLRSGKDLTVLNRSGQKEEDRMLSLRDSADVKNHLVLTESYLGQNYYLAGEARSSGRVALSQLEPDYFRPGQTMSSSGRHLLFEVLGPLADSQMRVEFTASLNGDGENRVPPATIAGGVAFPLGAVGRGSARLQTPVTPVVMDNRSFLMLDMGVAPVSFREDRRGLLAWFGVDVPLDNRKITGFFREISMVTGVPAAPAFLADFKAGLANPDLLYSGAYEDGWVAEESFFQLRQPPGVDELTLKINVPDLPARPKSLAIRVDNEPPKTLELLPGAQEVRLPVPAVEADTTRRVELRFDRATPLSAADRRPASSLIESLGFRPPLPPKPGKEIPLSNLSLGGRWYPFEEFGGAKFRWVEGNAELWIDARTAGVGQLSIELEAGPGVGSKQFRLSVANDTGRIFERVCHGGRDKYPVELPVKTGRNRFRLSVAGGGLPTPNDPRILNFRIFSMAWSPPK